MKIVVDTKESLDYLWEKEELAIKDQIKELKWMLLVTDKSIYIWYWELVKSWFYLMHQITFIFNLKMLYKN